MIGKVAKCRKGITGLILRVAKRRASSISGSDTVIYTGICLDRGRVGQSWQSIHPEVIGNLDDWVKLRYTELKTVEQVATVAVTDDTPTKRNLMT